MTFFGLQRAWTAALAAMLALTFAAAGPPAFAANATGDAEAFVRGVGEEVVAVLKGTAAGSDEREAELREIFVKAFDNRTIARFVMGRYWRQLGDEDQERYLKVFPGYVAAIYARQFAEYGGQTFEVLKASPARERDIDISAEIRGGRAGQPIAIGILVRPYEDGFRMLDVRVEGVSLLVSKRDEFNAFLARRDASELIDRLEQIGGR